ncbi:unnamed protein product, partial [Adineta steineri]
TNHNENSFVEEEQMSEETPPIINLETQASNDNILTKNIDSNEELTDSNSNYIPTEIIQENEATSINLPETPVEEPIITFNSN